MSYHYYLFILSATGLLYEELYFISAETLEGYVHLISGVKSATKSSTKYFDLKLQTTESAGVRWCATRQKSDKNYSNPRRANHLSKSLALLRINQRGPVVKVKNTPY